jgi:hypothetical protein
VFLRTAAAGQRNKLPAYSTVLAKLLSLLQNLAPLKPMTQKEAKILPD